MLDRTLAASDRRGLFGVITKTLRLFLQSMMLGLGAWLAIHGQVTFGVMIAASILLGRALAPIDQAVAQWPTLQRMLHARRALAELLAQTPPEPARTSLPAPRAVLEAQALTVAAPGASVPAVRGASFRLEPGQVVGIAGPSASGKSTLARALGGSLAARRGLGAAGRGGARTVRPHARRARRLFAAGSGAVRGDRGREHRPHVPGREGRGRGRRGQAHRRARNGPEAARRLRLPGLGGGARCSPAGSDSASRSPAPSTDRPCWWSWTSRIRIWMPTARWRSRARCRRTRNGAAPR